jgi:hypothetical protein
MSFSAAQRCLDFRVLLRLPIRWKHSGLDPKCFLDPLLRFCLLGSFFEQLEDALTPSPLMTFELTPLCDVSLGLQRINRCSTIPPVSSDSYPSGLCDLPSMFPYLTKIRPTRRSRPPGLSLSPSKVRVESRVPKQRRRMLLDASHEVGCLSEYCKRRRRSLLA